MGITFPTLQAVFFTCYPQKLLTIRTKNVPCTFFVLDIIKMSTQIKKRLTIEKDMAILFSYVVNKINRMIMLKKRWRYLRIAGIT